MTQRPFRQISDSKENFVSQRYTFLLSHAALGSRIQLHSCTPKIPSPKQQGWVTPAVKLQYFTLTPGIVHFSPQTLQGHDAMILCFEYEGTPEGDGWLGRTAGAKTALPPASPEPEKPVHCKYQLRCAKMCLWFTSTLHE